MYINIYIYTVKFHLPLQPFECQCKEHSCQRHHCGYIGKMKSVNNNRSNTIAPLPQLPPTATTTITTTKDELPSPSLLLLHHTYKTAHDIV